MGGWGGPLGLRISRIWPASGCLVLALDGRDNTELSALIILIMIMTMIIIIIMITYDDSY